jgi:gas vesicle protein GvpL/GvpF
MAVPEELRRRLRAMARSDVEPLIEEARAEARGEVKAVLRDIYAEELLDLVAGHPGGTEMEDVEDGVWVYCIVAGGVPSPPAVTGVAGAEPVLVQGGELAALTGAVPLSEFGEAPLREHMNDLAWLERTVRAHEAVLESMLDRGPLVPMRICTIYRDVEQVRAMLESRTPAFREALARLSGKDEWGVKIVVQRVRLEDHARSRTAEADDVAGSEGVAYVARKKLAAAVRGEADRILDAVVRETHARLEEWSAGSVVLPAQNRELAGYDGDMVFNAAYLVEHERVHNFSRLLDELRTQYGPVGFGFELTGPWPAYNFAQEEAQA